MLRDGLAAKAGRAGETDDKAGTANMVSWKVQFWPEAARPERPALAGKGRVKAYECVGPQMPVPVSAEETGAVTVVAVVWPARLMRAMLFVWSALGGGGGGGGGDVVGTRTLTSRCSGQRRLRRFGCTAQVSTPCVALCVIIGREP